MMSEYTFCVITKLSENIEGNLYNAAEEVWIDRQMQNYPKGRKPVLGKSQNYMLRAFELGEILILDEPLGREVSGRQRAPRKWGNEYEEFDNLDNAVARAKEVLKHE